MHWQLIASKACQMTLKRNTMDHVKSPVAICHKVLHNEGRPLRHNLKLTVQACETQLLLCAGINIGGKTIFD